VDADTLCQQLDRAHQIAAVGVVGAACSISQAAPITMCANFMGPSQGLLGNKKLQGRMTTTSRKLLHGEQGWCAHRKIFKIKVLRVMMRMVILASLVFYNNRFVKEKQVKNVYTLPLRRRQSNSPLPSAPLQGAA
jgi:hypothetical protein